MDKMLSNLKMPGDSPQTSTSTPPNRTATMSSATASQPNDMSTSPDKKSESMGSRELGTFTLPMRGGPPAKRKRWPSLDMAEKTAAKKAKTEAQEDDGRDMAGKMDEMTTLPNVGSDMVAEKESQDKMEEDSNKINDTGDINKDIDTNQAATDRAIHVLNTFPLDHIGYTRRKLRVALATVFMAKPFYAVEYLGLVEQGVYDFWDFKSWTEAVLTVEEHALELDLGPESASESSESAVSEAESGSDDDDDGNGKRKWKPIWCGCCGDAEEAVYCANPDCRFDCFCLYCLKHGLGQDWTVPDEWICSFCVEGGVTIEGIRDAKAEADAEDESDLDGKTGLDEGRDGEPEMRDEGELGSQYDEDGDVEMK